MLYYILIAGLFLMIGMAIGAEMLSNKIKAESYIIGYTHGKEGINDIQYEIYKRYLNGTLL